MAKVKVYNKEGKKTEEIELSPKLFGFELNKGLLHEAAVAAMANSRKVYAHTKGRGEVRGGGRKPWRQKGTGRARHGSRRSPIWIGGGITFGPTKEREYSVKINKKVKQKALLIALSERSREDGIIVIDDLAIEEPKTKKITGILRSLPGVERNVLVVIDKPDRKLMRALQNVKWARVIGVNNLNILDVLNYPKILFTKDALPAAEKLYSVK